MRYFLPALLALTVSGCLPALATPPPNAPAAQVATCQADAKIHFGEVLGGTVLVGASAGLGFTAAEIDNGPRKTWEAVGISGGTAAVLGVGDIVLMAIEAKKYYDDGCGALTGTLPDATKKPQ